MIRADWLPLPVLCGSDSFSRVVGLVHYLLFKVLTFSSIGNMLGDSELINMC